MTLVAHLHGAPDRLPFVGHFRAARSCGNLAYAIAGSVAARSDVDTAFRAARCVEGALAGVALEGLNDKVVLLESVWAALLAVNACDLGPNEGSDLVALIAVLDDQGMGIAGPGLGGVWAWNQTTLTPLVQGAHPLLSSAGRPERLPGMLTLDSVCPSVVAVAHDHPVPTLQFNGLERRCGVNP